MRPLEMALNRQYTPTDTATKSAHSAITIHRVISFFPDFFSETDFKGEDYMPTLRKESYFTSCRENLAAAALRSNFNR